MQLDELTTRGRYAACRPAFALESAGPDRWWIVDGPTRVAMVDTAVHTLELTNAFPDAPQPVHMPVIYHAPTAPGDRITLATWVAWHQQTTSDRHELTVRCDHGAPVVRMVEDWDTGRHAERTCTVGIHPDFGYTVDVRLEVTDPDVQPLEFCNFLPQGVVDDRPGRQRWTHVVWEHPDGRLLSWPQNNVGAFAWGNRDHHGARQVEPDGGMLVYAGDRQRCPFLLFHGSTHPIAAATCHNMLDEHLHWVIRRSAPPTPAADGRHHYHVHFTLGALRPPAGDRLIDTATMNDLVLDRFDEALWQRYPKLRLPGERPGDPRRLDYVTFQQNRPCDFTVRLEPTRPDRVEVFAYPENDDTAPISLVAAGGHRTAPCLRLRATGGEPLVAGPDMGNSIHATPAVPCRFTAWVKTDLTAGEACLRVTEWLFTPRNVQRTHHSAALTGRTDWTELTVDFTPPDVPETHALSVELVVAGQGTVWTDDWLLAVDVTP